MISCAAPSPAAQTDQILTLLCVCACCCLGLLFAPQRTELHKWALSVLSRQSDLDLRRGLLLVFGVRLFGLLPSQASAALDEGPKIPQEK